jgi:hypothetical protein
MNTVSVYKNIQKFAIKSIDIGEFYGMLERSKSYNPVEIWWEKLDGDRTNREMYWGRFKGGKASQTRTERGEIALISIDDGREYRTVDLGTVWKCRFEEKTYYVK